MAARLDPERCAGDVRGAIWGGASFCRRAHVAGGFVLRRGHRRYAPLVAETAVAAARTSPAVFPVEIGTSATGSPFLGLPSDAGVQKGLLRSLLHCFPSCAAASAEWRFRDPDIYS